MATLLLSAAGAALGANVGGAVLGLSGMVIGRAVGATVGRVIDQRLMGHGSGAVDTDRIQRFQVTGAGEGVPLAQVWGRMRLAGQIIWASPFEQIPGRSRRTKGGLGPKVTEQTRYRVSVAIALCEGEITGVGRVWANANEVKREDLNLRVYTGSDNQSVDPKIEAVEGSDAAPAYRGTAYVVIEDLDLAPYGNRLPSFALEVIRAAQSEQETTLQDAVRGVAWMPGSGEYTLATEPVTLANDSTQIFDSGFSITSQNSLGQANADTPAGQANMPVAIEALRSELPNVGSSLLIASWFGDDLRCGECAIKPKVEFKDRDGRSQPWVVNGVTRANAEEVAREAGKPVYGGTPSDASIIQSIEALQANAQKVVFYPFLLMEQTGGNGLPDPWSDAADQPILPWRGRITTSQAPGRAGSPDQTAAATAEVAAFFGTAQPSDFTIAGQTVTYSGPTEWSYRRFILHYAALCAAAGGVDAFCIGSEMRALTQIRDEANGFPAVTQMVTLLRDVRSILGPNVKLTYAADWSEYWGYAPGGGARYFHLDPLWSDDDLDVIGIDNYMPVSDWRDGETHADADARTVYNLDYLKSNVARGEGYDWYYADEQARTDQRRTPITDGANEPWIWRYKDLRAWWETQHVERPNGVQATEPTDWVPGSKPIWFTEYGCAAIDKGGNQPNVFLDPKSSESKLPYFSNGARDDLMQMQYLRALHAYWADVENNPVSEIYNAPMVDWERSHAWAWDARPWPWFPANTDLWSDGDNWLRGHWLTGRATNQPLSAVVAEICEEAGIVDFDTSALYGVVRGYASSSTSTGRAKLQPLMLAYGFEALERNGRLIFQMRDGRDPVALDRATLVARDDGDLEMVRASAPETAGRLRLAYMEAEGNFATRSAEAVIPDEVTTDVAQSELPLALTQGEARTAVKRWLSEARVARDVARFSLPMSSELGVGDIVQLDHDGVWRDYRIDRVDLTGAREMEAVRVEQGLYRHKDVSDELPVTERYEAALPVLPVFLDLPIMRGDEVPHAPHLAVTGRPWPGSVAVYDAPASGGTFDLNTVLGQRSTIGQTRTPLFAARPAIWHRGAGVEVEFAQSANLSAVQMGEVLSGKNIAAIGTGADWEVFQFTGAELIEPGVWRLSNLLRGQFGTEPLIPTSWPPGAIVVLLDGAPEQVDLPASLRGVARRWRMGSAALAYDDPTYVERVETARGVGLRPYAPVFLEAKLNAQTASYDLSWLRRTRVGGDDWDGLDVPLSEEREQYLLRIRHAGAVVREVVLDTPSFEYTTAARSQDGVTGAFEIDVAQVSGSFGPGLSARMTVAA